MGKKSCGWKNLNILLVIYSTHIKIAQRGWFRWECLQCASTSCFIIIIIWASSFSPLLGLTRSRSRCWVANRLSHHPEPSGCAIHGEVAGLNSGRQHVQRFDIPLHTHKPRSGHTPFVQIGAETSDTGAEAVEPDQRCSWQGYSRRVGRGWKYGSRSALQHFSIHRWSAQSVALMLLSSNELMSCCAAGTNGCLDMRCREFPPRSPSPVKQRARESLGPLRQNSAGWISARIGRLSAGVGGGCEHCDTRQERSTLLLNRPGIWWLFATLLLQHPSQSQHAASRAQGVMSTCEVSRGVGDTWVSCPTLLRGRPMGSEKKGRVSLLSLTSSSRLASLLLRWKTAKTAF